MIRQLTRRRLLGNGLLGCIGCLTVLEARSASTVCADPDKMDDGKLEMRQSLNYTEQSPDPGTTCKDCHFFAATEGGCGTCVMFNGDLANANGYCDSFSPKSESPKSESPKSGS